MADKTPVTMQLFKVVGTVPLPDNLIAGKPFFGHADMDKMQNLPDSHVVGDNRIIEIGFRERILIHFGNIFFFHESRVGISKSCDSRLERSVCMSRADTKALRFRSFNIRTVAVSAEC